MKNTSLFLLALSTLALASCTEDEAVNLEKGNSISFRPAMGTRATETTNANLKEITVAAFQGNQRSPFFNPTSFVKGSDGFFTSTPEYYWPGDDSSIDFYAYSPAAPGGTLTMASDEKTLTDFSPASDIDSQVDFITASASGNKARNEASGLELTFDHRLSQIEIQAKADTAAYEYKISGIRIGQPIAKGSFDFADNSWTLGSDKAIYEETYDTPKVLSPDKAINVMGDEGNAMLIPQQLTAWDPATDASNSAAGAYLSVKLQINTKAGAQVYPFPSDAECVWAAIPINTNWEAGKKYVYVLDVTHGGYVDPNDPQPGKPVLGGPIKFTVDVTEWTSSTQDVPMDTK